jgi:hypothetical protein
VPGLVDTITTPEAELQTEFTDLPSRTDEATSTVAGAMVYQQ